MFMKFLVKIKKCFDLINYSVKSDKYETDVVAIEILVGLKPKMYSLSEADGSAHKKRIKILLQEKDIVHAYIFL